VSRNQKQEAGALGGKAGWAKLNPEERRLKAQKIARARWSKRKKKAPQSQAA
jgi:hypothetical protein